MKHKIILWSWRRNDESLEEIGDDLGFSKVKDAKWRAKLNKGRIVKVTVEETVTGEVSKGYEAWRTSKGESTGGAE